jgi:phage terminase large subunit
MTSPDELEQLPDEELAKILLQLRSVSSLPYAATEKQLEFHMHPARGSDEPVLFGGAFGGGKSAALAAEAIRECIDIPRNRVLLARKELVVFKRTTLQEVFKLLESLPFKVVHRISESRFLFPNGSELYYMGLGTEKDREKLKGLEIGMLGIDEASEITREIYQTVAARLRYVQPRTWMAQGRLYR